MSDWRRWGTFSSRTLGRGIPSIKATLLCRQIMQEKEQEVTEVRVDDQRVDGWNWY